MSAIKYRFDLPTLKTMAFLFKTLIEMCPLSINIDRAILNLCIFVLSAFVCVLLSVDLTEWLFVWLVQK